MEKESRESTQGADPQPTVDDVPDPEEDDLDDLDDLLDEFSSPKLDKIENSETKSEPGKQGKLHSNDDSLDAAASDFSEQLQQQMAALMGDVEESPKMRQEITAIMQELTTVADTQLSSFEQSCPELKSSGTKAPPDEEEPFQQTIRKTMERMQASGEQATAAAASEDSETMLAQMLKEMQSGGLEDAGVEEDFSKMLMGMMEQLTNKDILFEPMKELYDKYPAWMSRNRGSTKVDDLQRYEEQQRLVGEIVEKFQEEAYSDSNPTDREFIVERMQQMQSAGSPPADLIGNMNAAQEALGDLDSGCTQQ